MRLTAKQSKAFAWYVQKNKLRPELSAHPLYRFSDQGGGITEVQLDEIVILHATFLEEERMSKKEEKRRKRKS